jgi:hypothetical protein
MLHSGAQKGDSILKFTEHHALQLIVAHAAAATLTCLENMFAYAVIEAGSVSILIGRQCAEFVHDRIGNVLENFELI